MALFSPGVRLRQASVAGYQNDNALDEVFRLAPHPETLRSERKHFEERQTHSVVNNWMEEGANASPPQEQDRSIVDRLETRRKARKATLLRQRGISGTRSVASDPAEFMSRSGFHDYGTDTRNEDAQETEDDGDDELNTHDGEELEKQTTRSRSHGATSYNQNDEGYFATQLQARMAPPPLSSSAASSRRHLAPPRTSPPQQRRSHDRTMSTGTILFNPLEDSQSSASPPKSRPLTAKYRSTTNTGTHTPTGLSGHQTPRQTAVPKAKPRPILPGRQNFQSVPNFNIDSQLAGNGTRTRQIRHRRSSLDMGMSDMGLDNNAGMLGAVPSSFATQMAMATGGLKAFQGSRSKEAETERMMGRLMLARMKTLEEGFAEVVREFRGMRTAGNSSVENESVDYRRDKGKGREKEKEKAPQRKRKSGVPRSTSETDFAMIDRGRSGDRRDGPAEYSGNRHTPEVKILRRHMSKGSSL